MADPKVIIFSAPSGSGKTTIVHSIMARDHRLAFSVSATSRSPREKEQHGVDYYFLSVEEFKEKISNEEFVEWEEVYEGRFYGTLKSEVQRISDVGKIAVFDVDVEGGVNLKKIFGENALALFIEPPSLEILRKRLENRGTEKPEEVNFRLEKASREMEFKNQFDVAVINDNLATAIEQVELLIKDFSASIE